LDSLGELKLLRSRYTNPGRWE